MNQGKAYLPKNIFQRKISNNRPLVGKFVSHNFTRLSLFHYEMRRCNCECLGECRKQVCIKVFSLSRKLWLLPPRPCPEFKIYWKFKKEIHQYDCLCEIISWSLFVYKESETSQAGMIPTIWVGAEILFINYGAWVLWWKYRPNM